MTTDDWTLKNMGHASPDDHELFEKWCGPTIREFGPKNGLGRNGKPMPQGAGAHCIQWWEDAISLIDRRVILIGEIGGIMDHIKVFEIGFCIGLSARILLEIGVGKVVSVDSSDHEECLQSAKQMERSLKGRFTFENQRSDQFRDGGRQFNLAFIDGDHAYSSIITDIAVCRCLGIKTMVFDDWHPHFGPDTQQAVIDSNLRVRAIIGNYALCEDDL